MAAVKTAIKLLRLLQETLSRFLFSAGGIGAAWLCWGIWWAMAFDWDPKATPPALAGVALGLGLLCLTISAVSAARAVWSGVLLMRAVCTFGKRRRTVPLPPPLRGNS